MKRASLLVTILIANSVVAQSDVQDIKDDLKKFANWQRMFVGVGGEAVRESFTNGKRVRITHYVFDHLKPDVWRIQTSGELDRETGEAFRLVTIRDGDFVFNALSSSEQRFRYKKLGFEPGLHSELMNSWLSQFPFPVAASHFEGVSLPVLFSTIETEIKRREPIDSYLGHQVERIEFDTTIRSKDQGDARNANIIIEWLPDDGFLVRRIAMQIDNQLLVEKTIEYQVLDGRLLPNRIESSRAEGRIDHFVITSLRTANSDRSFYRAESIGLTTPQRPTSPRQKWVGLSIVCLASGVYFLWKSRIRGRQ